jgi:DNA modification methylase
MAKIEITRTELVWPGKYNEDGTTKDLPRLDLPFQVIETINERRAARGPRTGAVQPTLFDVYEGMEGDTFDQGWRNKLIWGDNLLVMGSLMDRFAGKIDLIYIDPPFATGVDFSFTTEIGDDELALRKEQSALEEKAYRDTWGRGSTSFLDMMLSRLRLMRELLTDNGAIFVHMDWHFNHLVRALLDEIFGPECFVNEIVVNRGRRKSLQSQFATIAALGSEHDSVFLYSKRPNTQFAHVRSATRAKDAQWQSFWRGNVERPTMQYELLGFKPTTGQFLWSRERAERAVKNYQTFVKSGANDLVSYWERTGRTLEFVARFPNRAYPQYWIPPKDEGLIGDVWTDIQAYSYAWGYDTEKHEDLLTRVIEMATKRGDLVADFFSGSGTTAAVAEKLGRRWVGCDLGRWAVHLTRKRLLSIEDCRPFEVLNLGKYERQYWQGVTFGQEKDSTSAERALYEYLAFILRLYGAQPVPGMTHLHGKKGSAMIHIGAVDAPVTFAEIDAAVDECSRLRQGELHVLGWEWEMGLYDLMVDAARKKGVKLLLLQIPREVMERQAAAKGDVHFFELAYLEVEIKQPSKLAAQVALKDFVIPNTELIPDEVRSKIKKWSDYIDYWAVDWDFRNDTFMQGWVAFRTRKERKLALCSDQHIFERPGKYRILAKVIDVFGNDTSQAFDLEVK